SRHEQLRRRLRTLQAGRPRLAHRADGGDRGHPGTGHGCGDTLELGDVSSIPRRTGCARQRYRLRRAGAACAGARVRDGPACCYLRRFVERANAASVAVCGQVSTRAIGSMYGLGLWGHPFISCGGYRVLADLPLGERVARMRRPELRARILSEAPEALAQLRV